MKRFVSCVMAGAMALSLCAIPTFAQGTTQKDFFTTNGYEVMQSEPDELAVTFINYTSKRHEWKIGTDGTMTCTSTRTPAAKAGYETVTLNIEMNLPTQCPSEYGEPHSYDYTGYTMGDAIYDYYTGELFDRKGTDGDTTNHYTKMLTYNGREYPIEYTQSIEWDYDLSLGNAVPGKKDEYYYDYWAAMPKQIWTFTVPKGYNGFVYCLNAYTKDPFEEEFDSETLYKGSYVPQAGDQLFRFATNLTPDDPIQGLDVEININNADDDDPYLGDYGYAYTCSVVNNTGKTVEVNTLIGGYHYYSAPSYSANPSEPLFGVDMLPIQVTLAPDESYQTAFYVDYPFTAYNKFKFVFDDAAEMASFMNSSHVYEGTPGTGMYEAGCHVGGAAEKWFEGWFKLATGHELRR